MEERPLAGGQIKIGRRPPPTTATPESYLQINDQSVSREHCELFFRGLDLFVQDLGSTNGTFVRGQRLSHRSPVQVQAGDEIRVGELFLLGVEAELIPEPLPASGGGQDIFGSPSAATGSGFTGLDQIDDILSGLTNKKPKTVEYGQAAIDDAIDWGTAEDMSSDLPVDWDEPSVPAAAPPNLSPLEPSSTAPSNNPFGAPVPTEPDQDDPWGESIESTPSAPEPDATTAPEVPSQSAASAGLHAFLRGAGLSPGHFAGLQDEEVLERAGAIYRQAVLNYADFLRSRDSVKEEYKVERTQIGAANNNPLKVLPAETAANVMLKAPEPGFLDGAEAFHSAGTDLKKHQVGLLAGTRSALEALLQELEKAAAHESGGFKISLPGQKQAADAGFGAVLTALREELQGNRRGTVFQAFRTAYDRVTREG